MKKLLQYLALSVMLFSMTLLFTACPESGDEPGDDGSSSVVDNPILGMWQSVDNGTYFTFYNDGTGIIDCGCSGYFYHKFSYSYDKTSGKISVVSPVLNFSGVVTDLSSTLLMIDVNFLNGDSSDSDCSKRFAGIEMMSFQKVKSFNESSVSKVTKQMIVGKWVEMDTEGGSYEFGYVFNNDNTGYVYEKSQHHLEYFTYTFDVLSMTIDISFQDNKYADVGKLNVESLTNHTLWLGYSDIDLYLKVE